MKRKVRFGIIGGGLMGREFASAVARWLHLTSMPAVPEIVAVCRRDLAAASWFTDNIPSITQVTADYRELLANPDVEAVYIAVPHHLHREIYSAAVSAGKHLLGEKPFGIDLAANEAILAELARHPGVFARCSSEFPFFPAVQRIGSMISEQEFGRILEVNCAFRHSSDLDPLKPINWKRMVEFNGEYGCMGDLGMHVCHVPFRAGWSPVNVRAILSDVITQRPDGKGGVATCSTWDNATLLCESVDPVSGDHFPMVLKTQRIAPGHRNTWSLEIMGTKASASFTTCDPNAFQLLESQGGAQNWQRVEVGSQGAFGTITGGIFETGFSDAFQQMCAAFVNELVTGAPPVPSAACVTPAETNLHHRLLTAALESHHTSQTVAVG